MNSKPFVDFMIVGAMKSGTTSLSRIFKNQEEITFCSVKEPQFFSESPDWQAHLSAYKDLFPYHDKSKISGEASTGYTMLPEFNSKVWEDIYAFNPQMKIIYIMRDPIKRMVSHYIHNYMRGYTRLPINKAIVHDPSFVNRTRYYMQIKPYIDTFGREQVFLTTFEKFLSSKEQVLTELASFLELKQGFKDFQDVYSNKAIQDIDITVNRYVRNIKSTFIKRGINFLYKKLYGKKNFDPNIDEEMEAVIWKMLEQDIENIEKEMGRKIIEWPSCLKYKYNQLV